MCVLKIYANSREWKFGQMMLDNEEESQNSTSFAVTKFFNIFFPLLPFCFLVGFNQRISFSFLCVAVSFGCLLSILPPRYQLQRKLNRFFVLSFFPCCSCDDSQVSISPRKVSFSPFVDGPKNRAPSKLLRFSAFSERGASSPQKGKLSLFAFRT